MKPLSLLARPSSAAVFGVIGRGSQKSVELGTPGDSAARVEEHITHGGAKSVRVIGVSSVVIAVDTRLSWGLREVVNEMVVGVGDDPAYQALIA